MMIDYSFKQIRLTLNFIEIIIERFILVYVRIVMIHIQKFASFKWIKVSKQNYTKHTMNLNKSLQFQVLVAKTHW